MNKHNRVTTSTITRLFALGCLLPGMASAAGFGVEARSLAMGNASVATADIATAALTNPAMLALQKQEDDFALLLPSVGVFIDDSDGVIDQMEQFQNEANACSGGSAPACAAAQNTYNAMIGQVISPQASGAFALGVAGTDFSFAISARTDVAFAGGVTAPTDFTIGGINNPGVNQLQMLGLQTTELGVSFAGNYEIAGMKVAAGITPKIVSVEALQFAENVFTLDTDVGGLLDENNVTDLGEVTTLDAGIMMSVTENVQLGLVARNLIGDTLTSGPISVDFDTQLRAGLAYNGDVFTLGVDLDLTENEIAGGAAESQMMSVGVEIDAFEIAQLRFGMQQNVADNANDDALLTAGVGLSFGIHVDVAVIGNDDTFGAFAQTGFRF